VFFAGNDVFLQKLLQKLIKGHLSYNNGAQGYNMKTFL